jgi:PAS domain S-box-containing protein
MSQMHLETAHSAAGSSDAAQILALFSAISDIVLLYGNALDQLLPKLIRPIVEILDLSAGAILFLDDTQQTVQVAAIQTRIAAPANAPGAEVLWRAPLLEHTQRLALQTAASGAPLLDTDTAFMDALTRSQAGHLVSVPLRAGGWLTGILQAAALPNASISPHQVQILLVLAQQLAGAIENARLFTQTRAEQERTRAVVDATNDAILMLDERWRPMIVNRRARFFFGLSEHELLGHDYTQLCATITHLFEDGERFAGWLTAQLRSPGARAVAEFRLRQPELRLLQCFTAPVMDVHERVLGRILVFRDITREREVERMKNDFVATVSHELRTPLTSIRGALQLILGQPQLGRDGIGGDLPPRASELLRISLANTERLIRLISDMLDVARIEQGRIQLQRAALAPADLCYAATDEVRAFADTRAISIQLDLPADLPQVNADRDRAVQILVNLLSNAIKFSPHGQSVHLRARREGKMIVFTVRDWGRGIAPEDQHRLFQKFQQLDNSTTRDTGGTGLGLSICKALVEEHGGRIWLDSAIDRGSSFSFSLPLADPVGAAAEPEPIVIGLIAGDEERRKSLCNALESTGNTILPITQLTTAAIARSGARLIVVDVASAQSPEAALLNGLRGDPATQALGLLVLADQRVPTPHDAVKLPPTTAPSQIAARAQELLEHPQPLVLVVDDDQHVRPVLVRLIRRHGLRAISAPDGFTALELAARQQPSVILLDIKMPELNGYDVLRRLQQHPLTVNVPVIFLTGNDPQDQRGLELNAPQVAGYLEKPITAKRLMGAITGVIARNERPDGAPST